MPATPARCLATAAIAVLGALLAPAASVADDAVADLTRDAPVAAYGGALAWSAYDELARAYVLVIRRRGLTSPARVPIARRPFDVSLGPDSKGRVVALYTRCRTAGTGCDVYRYDLRTSHERKLASVSSPGFDEAWPAQWRERISFVRRARTRVVDGYDHRPDPRGRGPVMDCDVPYVKTLGSRAPSRRLDRSQCGETTGMAIRRDTIVLVTDINQGGAGSESQVRRLRASGGAARILARTGGGEGGYSPFVSPNISASAVWLARIGRRQEVQPGFLRIDLASARLQTVPGDVRRLARDEDGRVWYLEGPEPDWDFDRSCRSSAEPCRLVRASANPFSSTPRRLLARVRIDGVPYADVREGFADGPLVLSGVLSGVIVSRGVARRSEGVAGVAVALVRTRSLERPGPFIKTRVTTTTDAAGRWALSLPNPPPQITLAVLAPAVSATSVLVRVTSSLRMTLSAAGTALAGTVAPAQPGRSVALQRIVADARSRLPDGRQICAGTPTATNCAENAWATVMRVPLDASGAAFAAQAPVAGIYRALLTAQPDAAGQATAYGGVSPAVRAGG